MAKPVLVIGNKNYSSWSLRPYMALAEAGIPFEEKLIQFGEPAFGKAVSKISGAARVPVLLHGKLTIWDSLAILEYLAEKWPAKNLWPKSLAARSFARSVCAEMHSGFGALRNACPMNIRRKPSPLKLSDAVLQDVSRIEDIWRQCRNSYGKSGPFLFGKFSNADAMFAPVASRLVTYDIKLSAESRKYVQAVLSTSAFQQWQQGALAEPWIVPEDEVD